MIQPTNGTTALQTQHEPMMQWSAEQLQVVKSVLAPGLSNDELKLFAAVCRRTGLDPFSRQIYAIKRGGRLCIQAGIDGYRALAEKSGRYEGQYGPFWCGEDGEWHDVWLKKEPPVACRVGIFRSDFKQPLFCVGRYAAYVQPSNALWTTMPDTMLAKCVEALALRKAFPQMYHGIYTTEEMEQADTVEGEVVDPWEAPRQLAKQLGYDAQRWKALVHQQVTGTPDKALAFLQEQARRKLNEKAAEQESEEDAHLIPDEHLETALVHLQDELRRFPAD